MTSAVVLMIFLTFAAITHQNKHKRATSFYAKNTECLSARTVRVLTMLDSLHQCDLKLGTLQTKTFLGNQKLIDDILMTHLTGAQQMRVRSVLRQISAQTKIDHSNYLSQCDYRSPTLFMNLYRGDVMKKYISIADGDSEIFDIISMQYQSPTVQTIRAAHLRVMGALAGESTRLSADQGILKRELYQRAGIEHEYDALAQTMMEKYIDVEKPLTMMRSKKHAFIK